MPLEVILILGGIIASMLAFGYYRLAKVGGRVYKVIKAGSRGAGGVKANPFP